ncbi:MAG: hypothetical protein M9894_31155 [Planctomycetes bacterium]|nr:hypothetical protein [Planctomycetota bacterium]
MGDERLRSSERRWRETGAPEDGRVLLVELERAGAPTARVLRARVQVGVLPEARLRLAALLGDPAAQEALGEPPPRGALREAVDAWVSGLGAYGPEPWPRVAVAIARLLQAEFEGEDPPAPHLEQAADLVEALLCGEALPVTAPLRLLDAMAPDLDRRTRRVDPSHPRGRARSCATYAARAVAEVGVLLAEGSLEPTRSAARVTTSRAVEALIYAQAAAVEGDLGAVWDDLKVAAEARVRAAVRGRLLPWALGA